MNLMNSMNENLKKIHSNIRTDLKIYWLDNYVPPEGEKIRKKPKSF